jgi:ribosomal protein S17
MDGQKDDMDDYDLKQTKFSHDAEEMLQAYRDKLKPKVHTATVQTDVSDVMQALHTLQQQKNYLHLELEQCRHELIKKDQTIANMRSSMNERLEKAEEKVMRLQTRNTAIENMVSFRRNEEKVLRTPIKPDHGASSTAAFVETEGLSYSAKVKIGLLEKRLEDQQLLEDKIMHLEKRNIGIARERGGERMKIMELENDLLGSKRQMGLAISEKNIAQKETKQLREQYKTLQDDFQTIDALSKIQGQDIYELRDSLLHHQSYHEMESAKMQKTIAMLTQYGKHIQKDYSSYRAKMAQVANQFVAIKKQLVRTKGFVFNFPNIAALRGQIMTSVENAKILMVAQEKEKLERKFKRNIIRTKQLEIQAEECQELLRVRAEELRNCRERLMKATVDNKLQAKIMEEVTNEASDLRGQQNIKVEVRTKLEAEINELRMENQEAAVHANELEIRNNLLNKLLTSERENNSKFEEIVLSKRPEMETLRIKLADVTEKYEKMVVDMDALTRESSSKGDQCLELQTKNESVAYELKALKSMFRQKLDHVLVVSEGAPKEDKGKK